MTNDARTAITIFPAAGFVSGLCSGLSIIAQPLGLVLPGVFFGIAIVHAIQRSIHPVTPFRAIVLTASSWFAYFAAVFVWIVSMRKLGNGIDAGVISGSLAGSAGAFLVAIGVLIQVRFVHPVCMAIAVVAAGALLGALFILIGIYISDHTALGHPFDDLITFPLWQTGVAFVISVFPTHRSRTI